MRFYIRFLVIIFLILLTVRNFAATITINPVIRPDIYQSGVNPALEALIKKNLALKQYKESLILLDGEIKKNPKNASLLYKRASIYADLGKYQNSLNSLEEILQFEPKNLEAIHLKEKIAKLKSETPYNELGLDWNEAYVSDLKAYWANSSTHYYHLTDNGKYGGHLNYAHRNGDSAVQYQFEAYPLITHQISASLSFAYANQSQILFPSYQYSVEGYFRIKNGADISLGQEGEFFSALSHRKIFTYTASFNQYFDKYLVWIRPYHYTPVNTELYVAGLRRYFKDENNYLNFRIGAGKVPDIGNVAPLDQLIIVNQKFGAGFDGQIALTKRTFLKFGVGYVKLFYPSGILREITDASLGLSGLF